MRIAAIDIGTNSIHMIVVQVRPDLSFEIIDREKAMVRLGAGGLGGRALTPEAADAALLALARFKRLADAHGVEVVLAAATSATREARNGGDFLRRIERDTGIRTRVISGQEEARLIYLAASYGVNIGRGRAVVIDIGGGSVEVVLGTANAPQLSRSFKLGSIRLTERLVASDPLTAREERKIVKRIRAEIDRHCAQIAAAGFDVVIGTSGTILSLGAMAAAERGAHAADLHHLEVSAKQIRKVRKQLCRLDLEHRLGLPGLDPRRADVIVAGAIVLDTILERLRATDLTLCELALREGLVLDYIHRNRRHVSHVDRIPDVRRRSTLELAERCNYLADHADQVVRLSLALFDQLRTVHGLTDREREWLEYAALMHDIGAHISYARHHKHSYYLIKHGELRGFSPEEIEIIALVARFHRRGTPQGADESYNTLPRQARRAVRALASILRLAESLDRSHAQAVSAVEVQDATEAVTLRVTTSGDAELELWAAGRHVKPFAKMVGKPVVIAAALDQAPALPTPTSRGRTGTVNTELTVRKPRRNRRTLA